jgi:predicted transcriptional regulator
VCPQSPQSPVLSGGSGVYKPYGGSVKENTFLGDLEFQILSYYVNSGFVVDSLTAIARSINADVRRVYDAIKRLTSRGFLEKVRRGAYKITEAGRQAVLKLKVRKLSKKSKENKENGNTREASQGKPQGTGGGLGGCVVGGFGGGVGWGGLFLDNVRWWCGGRFYQLGRGWVLGLGDLVFADRVSYCEVGHWVWGLGLDGVVVVYSNVEDGGRVRVEWRPPAGFVARNGVASAVRYGGREFVKAFKALAVVVRESVPRRELERLFRWVEWAWFRVGWGKG